MQSAEEKEQFFQYVAVPFVNKLASDFELEGTLRFLVNKSIVKVIIGDMLVHPNGMDGCTQARALSLFEPLDATDDDIDVAVVEQDMYVATIKTVKRSSLVVGCVALGASFRMATNMFASD